MSALYYSPLALDLKATFGLAYLHWFSIDQFPQLMRRIVLIIALGTFRSMVYSVAEELAYRDCRGGEKNVLLKR